MKIRKQVRALHRTLCDEAYKVLREHDCGVFFDNGGACVLCSLISIKKIFAAIHLAREKGLCAQWLGAERSLYDLLGEKAFFNKIEIELKEVANFPRKECDNCGHIVTFFNSFKKLARSTSSRLKMADCSYCGNRVELKELPMLPPSKEKYKIKEDSPPRLRTSRHDLPPTKSHVTTLEDVGLSLITKPKAESSPTQTMPNPPPALATITMSEPQLTSVVDTPAYTIANHYITQIAHNGIMAGVVAAGGGTGGGGGGSGAFVTQGQVDSDPVPSVYSSIEEQQRVNEEWFRRERERARRHREG